MLVQVVHIKDIIATSHVDIQMCQSGCVHLIIQVLKETYQIWHYMRDTISEKQYKLNQVQNANDPYQWCN